jgi:hypothetical protein
MTTGPVGRTRTSGAGHRVALVVVTVLMAAGATLSGCTSARISLGTNASPCFDALAIAESAVHRSGTFAGVRQVSLTQISADAHLQAYLAPLSKTVHDVCVVAFRGTFQVEDVERPLGPPPPGGVGHFAIVIVAKPQNHLVGTVVRSTQPLRFGHSI